MQVRWPVMILTQKGSVGGEIKNISLVGAFIHSPDGLSGQSLRLIVKPPQAKRPFGIDAAATWKNISASGDPLPSAGTGVRFRQFLNNSLNYISKIVSI
jgi:hypothetical protein